MACRSVRSNTALVGQCKDPLRPLDVSQLVAPQIHQGLAYLPRKSLRNEHLLVEPLGQVQEPAGPVHRRADDREIQPMRGSDIPIGHLADMQGQAMDQS